MAVFVLLHGLFTGAFVWDQTADRLRALGHGVVQPNLRGMGARAENSPRAQGLDDFVDDVCACLEQHDVRQAVLVGHSFAGMLLPVLSQKAGQRIRSLLYVDGQSPIKDKSFADLAGPYFSPMLAAKTDAQGRTHPWPPQAFGLAGHPGWDALASRMQPVPATLFHDPAKVGVADIDTPSVFLRCQQNLVPFMDESAARVAQHGGKVLLLNAPHSPMISHADTLANALDRLQGD